MAAFCLLAASGLPIITRYVLLPATILAIFCAAGAFGWQRLPDNERRHKQIWGGFGMAVLVLLIAFAPGQADRLERLKGSIVLQEQIRDDLHRLVQQAHLPQAKCTVAVPNHRAVPLLALWLDRRPWTVISAQGNEIRHGYLLLPANKRVEQNFILDRRDLKQAHTTVPPGFHFQEQNRSWKLYENCKL